MPALPGPSEQQHREGRLLDVAAFQRWVLGDLVDNANRGIFAEWLVGQALDAIKQGEARHGWAAFDLRHGEVTVEVKATGLSQTWNRHEQSKQPSFDIAPRRWTWDANTEEWVEFEPPERLAQIYVFCLHEPVPATNSNVRDPACWRFWVIPTQTLNEHLGPQKTVGTSTLGRLTKPVGWPQLRSEVDRCINP